jgi:Flp pilus assembly protein TadD
MRKKEPWSRNDKLVVGGLALALITAVSAFFIPEVRRAIGLDKPASVQAPVRVQTSTAPSAVAPSQAAPTEKKKSAPQHASARTSGPNSPAVGSIQQGPGSALSIGQQGGMTAGTINIASPNAVYNYDGSLKRTGSAWNTRLDHRDPDATVMKIESELTQRREQEALSEAQGLMTSDPLWATPHILAGLSYTQLGNQEAAKTELQKARSLVPAGYEYEQDYVPHLQDLDEAIKQHEPKPPS